MSETQKSTAAARAPTERDRQREQTRQRVYECALDVFRRDGVEAARIDDIATLAGVSRGTFYFHYPTKDDVIAQVLLESEQRLVARLDGIPVTEPLAVALFTVADHMHDEFSEDPEILAGIGHVVLRLLTAGVNRLREGHPARIALIPHMQAAMDRGEVLGGPVPADLTTDFLLMNLFGAALTWCGHPLMPLGDMLRHVVAYFLRATANPDAGSPS